MPDPTDTTATTAAGGDAGTTAAATTTTDKTVLGGDAGGGAAATTTDDSLVAAGGDTPTWREDWREAFAGEDKGALSHLKRFTSPENFHKSYRDLQQRLSKGQTAAALPDGATDEEIAAYRKATGIPEKPDGYGFSFPDDAKPTDADKAALTDFQTFMHERNVLPSAATAAFDWYTKRMADGRAAQAEAAEAATLENMRELRMDFPPRELQRNNKIADEFLMKHFGGDQAQLDAVNQVLSLRLPSGVQVMHYAPFMKGLFTMARAYADDEALIGGDTATGGRSIDEEYKELIKKSVDKPKEFSQRDEARLNELATAKMRRDERGQRAA